MTREKETFFREKFQKPLADILQHSCNPLDDLLALQKQTRLDNDEFSNRAIAEKVLALNPVQKETVPTVRALFEKNSAFEKTALVIAEFLLEKADDQTVSPELRAQLLQLLLELADGRLTLESQFRQGCLVRYRQLAEKCRRSFVFPSLPSGENAALHCELARLLLFASYPAAEERAAADCLQMIQCERMDTETRKLKAVLLAKRFALELRVAALNFAGWKESDLSSLEFVSAATQKQNLLFEDDAAAALLSGLQLQYLVLKVVLVFAGACVKDFFRAEKALGAHRQTRSGVAVPKERREGEFVLELALFLDEARLPDFVPRKDALKLALLALMVLPPADDKCTEVSRGRTAELRKFLQKRRQDFCSSDEDADWVDAAERLCKQELVFFDNSEFVPLFDEGLVRKLGVFVSLVLFGEETGAAPEVFVNRFLMHSLEERFRRNCVAQNLLVLKSSFVNLRLDTLANMVRTDAQKTESVVRKLIDKKTLAAKIDKVGGSVEFLEHADRNPLAAVLARGNELLRELAALDGMLDREYVKGELT